MQTPRLPVRPLMLRRVIATALALAVTVVGVQTWRQAGAEAAWEERCEANAADAAEREATVTGHGRDVLVIGDSWSVGLGLADLSDSWPSRLPGRVRVAGFSGSGFARGSSPCGERDFATRAERVVPTGAPLVVVQGGLNDGNQPPALVAMGFLHLVRVLESRDVGRVLVVGPAPAPARSASVQRVDRLLAGLASSQGLAYLSAAHWDLTYQRDVLHPDEVGHQVFGDAVAAALATR